MSIGSFNMKRESLLIEEKINITLFKNCSNRKTRVWEIRYYYINIQIRIGMKRM